MEAGAAGARPNYQLQYTLEGHRRAVAAVKFSPDGDHIASASADKTLRVWSVEGRCVVTCSDPASKGISDVAWSADSQYLCSAGDDMLVTVWDVRHGKAVKRLRGHNNYVMCVNFSPNSNLIASGSFDESVRIWDFRSGKCLRTLPAHSDPVTAVDFNRDGSNLVSGSYDGLCRIWNTANGQCLYTVFNEQNPPVSAVRFSPNGRYILTSNLNDSISLWDFTKLKRVNEYKGHKNTKYPVSSTFCVTHAGEQYVISGGEDNAVHMWGVKDKQETSKLIGHSDVVMGVSCHPTQNVLASCAHERDPTVRIWMHK